MRNVRRWMILGVAGILCVSAVALTGCGGKNEQVVIYSNADEEAVVAMKKALDANGYEGKYILQTFGTSELGGKLLAEGSKIEADLVTMSTFYLESAQQENQMFCPLDFEARTLDTYPSYCAPITAQEGTMIVNTEVMKENNLELPVSLKDLAKSEYEGMISVTDIASSSTAWLLLQGLISEYGEDGAKEVLTGIYKNAGDHIEDSGSGPLKLVRAGETAIGFGLRQQAVADKEEGLPIDYVDPQEGNFTLTESAAVVDKGGESNPKAMEMAQCIIENAREDLLASYPVPLYEGEKADSKNQSKNPKVFPEKLTVELLKKHQELSEACK
ncbi:MAG: extracellular solute-binding protein [Blautia sp.]